jgi:glucose-6-phosphate 1-epimerase
MSLVGAHLLSWTVSAKSERLWLSTLSAMDGSAPIRGGVPLAWPQFADQGDLPLHGFARTKMWEVKGCEGKDGSVTVVLTLISEAADTTQSTAWGKHPFELDYVVTLTRTSLKMSLAVRNTGAAPFTWTGCLHTYLRTADIRKVAVRGLEGLQYTDKVDGMALKAEDQGALVVEAASCASKGFVDRIYHLGGRGGGVSQGGGGEEGDSSGSTLVWDEAGREGVLTVQQSSSWTDTVVFNPWETGKKGDKGPDFDDDGYNQLLCLEPAVAKEALSLEPGEEFTGWQLVTIN